MSQFSHSTTGAEVVQRFAAFADGKTILITGPSPSTLGSETAITIAKHSNPAHLLLLGRSASKLQPVLDIIHTDNPALKVTVIECDLSKLSSVRSAAKAISSTLAAANEKLDIVINNAGIMAVNPFRPTEDGFESQWAVNHLAHFLLTNLLYDDLAQGVRVVNLTSALHALGPVRWDDSNFGEGKNYDPWVAYGQSKTANILFAKAISQKFAKKQAKGFSVHPGVVMGTQLMQNSNVSKELLDEGMAAIVSKTTNGELKIEAMKNLEQGCATTLVAALDPTIEDGAYLKDCNISEPRPWARDGEDVLKLWKLSEELVGEKFEF